MLILASLALISCHDDELVSLNFNATMEQPTNADGSKVYLQNERFVYWELNDRITIASDKGFQNAAEDNKNYVARLVDANSMGGDEGEDFGFFNGVFVSNMVIGSKYFLGLYPCTEDAAWCSPTENSTDFGTVYATLPAVQGLRVNDKDDITFNKNVFPMVAWYGGTWTDTTTAFNLDFHSLASIVRLQLFNTTGNAFNLDSIVITSADNNRQLSGRFRVNNYKTEDPSLTATAAGTAANRKITINCQRSGVSLPMSSDSLRSFYLVLPAYKGRHDSTTFHLNMTIYADGGTHTASRSFNVTTRRNGITYMRALAVSGWDEGGSTTVGLVGNGTADRPYKIYSEDDFIYLRNCYNGPRHINGRPLSNNTYIRIMRSDITITPSKWDDGGGIDNFVGHMTYAANDNSSTPGVTNLSHRPLFKQINAGAVVEGLTVRSDASLLSFMIDQFSPLCQVNKGTIRNCRFSSGDGAMHVRGYDVSGICVTNQGTIEGCGVVGRIEAESHQVAGICLLNDGGTIRGCYAAAPTTISGATSASLICHTNTSSATHDAVVEDCYVAAVVNGSTAFPVGCIVYNNTNGIIRHCYTSDAAIIYTTSTIGGIAAITGAYSLIEYCWSDATLRGARLGTVVATMNGGTVRNCYCNNPLMQITLQATNADNYGGGLVGLMTGGTIENSFVNITQVTLINNIGTAGGLVGRIEGSTARINNCYAYESNSIYHRFFGSVDEDVTENTFTNCYIVGANSTDYVGHLDYVTYGESYINTMRLSLNGGANPPYNDGNPEPTGWNSNWKHWIKTSNSNFMPMLQSYSR